MVPASRPPLGLGTVAATIIYSKCVGNCSTFNSCDSARIIYQLDCDKFSINIFFINFDTITQKPRRQLKPDNGPTLYPGSFLSQEKDPGWVLSCATQILGGNK